MIFQAKGTRTVFCLLLYGTSFSLYHFWIGYFTIVKPQSKFTKIKIISGQISEFLAGGSMSVQKYWLLNVMTFPLSCFSLVPDLHFFLPLSPRLSTMPVPHHEAQAKVMFLQRSQGHQNLHFFVVTCYFSPGMEKLISCPCIPPYWEWSSSFPLRGGVLLPFFTGWTSVNENHYWAHSIYLSGDILGEEKFLSQDTASQMLNLKFRGKMKLKCWLSPAEIGAFLGPDSVK